MAAIRDVSLDELADKDILTLQDVQHLRHNWPEPSPDVAAANLATRVERAPQYCCFLTFERLNLLRLYKLQHAILTYRPDGVGQREGFYGTSPPVPVEPTSSMAGGREGLMSPVVSFPGTARPEISSLSLSLPTLNLGSRQITVSSSTISRLPVSSSQPIPSRISSPSPPTLNLGSGQTTVSSSMISSLPVSSSQPIPSSKLKPFDKSSVQPLPVSLEELGVFNGELDSGLENLLREYNRSLRLFKEMQSWSRTTSESCAIARSDFAFHFREEKYVLTRESMYDLSPRGGSSQTDGVRQWLIERLPLRYVNPVAWDLRRTRQDRGRGGPDSGGLRLWMQKKFLRYDNGRPTKKGRDGDDVIEAGERARIDRTATSASVRETRDIAPFVDDVARILVSIAAGLFLLIPMIVLSFITSQRARLGTTVAFVIVFAVVLGRFSKASNDALMGSTAAYAAVLVVFVGQTTPIL